MPVHENSRHCRSAPSRHPARGTAAARPRRASSAAPLALSSQTSRGTKTGRKGSRCGAAAGWPRGVPRRTLRPPVVSYNSGEHAAKTYLNVADVHPPPLRRLPARLLWRGRALTPDEAANQPKPCAEGAPRESRPLLDARRKGVVLREFHQRALRSERVLSVSSIACYHS